jgi:hypothetical protein
MMRAGFGAFPENDTFPVTSPAVATPAQAINSAATATDLQFIVLPPYHVCFVCMMFHTQRVDT